MHVMLALAPWFEAMAVNPISFKRQMQVHFGMAFDKEYWTLKQDVIRVINQICEAQFEQSSTWSDVYFSRKSLLKAHPEYVFLFPLEAQNERNRTRCHLYEAWYVIAFICIKHRRLDHWISKFNLSEQGAALEGKEIIFDGEIFVNEIRIKGSGILSL